MNISLWAIIEALSALIETILIFMFASAFFKERRTLRKPLVLTLFLCVCIAKFLISYFLKDSILIILSSTILFTFIVCLTTRQCTVLWAVLSAFIYLLCAIGAELLAAVIISISQTVTFQQVADFTKYRFAALIIMDLLKFLLIKIIMRLRVGSMEVMRSRLWIPLWMLPIFSIFLALQFTIDALSDYSPQTITTLFCIFGLVLINMAVFSIMEELIRRSEKDKRLALLDAQVAAQRDYILQLTENRAQIRQMSHDFKQHVHMFRSLCEMGQFDELSDSLAKLTDWQHDVTPVVLTDNPMLDALLSAKRNLAKKNHIQCHWDIQVPPQMSDLTVDICALFGNALDNAIEACMRSDKERFIHMRVSMYKTNMLTVIENTIGERPQYDGTFLHTLKNDKDSHGLGLISMQATARSLGGELSFEFDENVFRLLFSIPRIPILHD